MQIDKRIYALSILLLGISLSSCSDDDNSLLSSSQNTFDFCQIDGIKSDPHSSQVWSAQDVQYRLQGLRANPRMGRTPLAAYTVAYQKMTAKRDQERCQGQLTLEDPFFAQMNHLLSDIMTRWYVTINQGCLNGEIEDNGFCRLLDTIRDDQYDALSAAMASTAVYLSSHLALSFSAIIYVDDFWNESPFLETHRAGQNWEDVRKARLDYMRQFKPAFDLFNKFLADSLSVVAIALNEEGLVKGDGLNVVSGLGQFLPFRASLFGRIRDQAYRSAIRIAETTDPEDHPMVIIVGGRSRLNFGRYQEGRFAETFVASAESFALDAVASPFSRYIYRSLLGGKTWEELQKERGFNAQFAL